MYKRQDKKYQSELEFFERVHEALDAGKPARSVACDEEEMCIRDRLCVKRVRRVYVNAMSAPQNSATREQIKNEDTVIPDEVKLANTVSMGISFLKSNKLFRMHARLSLIHI